MLTIKYIVLNLPTLYFSSRIPAEDLLPQRKHKRSWDEDKAYESSILLFQSCVHSTFPELNNLCPRPNSLYAIFEAIDLQWDCCIANHFHFIYVQKLMLDMP
jgi:hypothetical protein